MATGLDRIIEQILADAEAKAAEQVAATEEEAKKTLADAAAEAEQKANVLLADSEKVGADIKARALRPRNSHAAAPCLPQSRTPFAM